jgi:hypothetical protein
VGTFTRVGNFYAPYIAAFGPAGSWKAGSPSLDFNSDGLVSSIDVEYFARYHTDQIPLADLGREGGLPGPDGIVDSNDWVVFLHRYFSLRQ